MEESQDQPKEQQVAIIKKEEEEEEPDKEFIQQRKKELAQVLKNEERLKLKERERIKREIAEGITTTTATATTTTTTDTNSELNTVIDEENGNDGKVDIALEDGENGLDDENGELSSYNSPHVVNDANINDITTEDVAVDVLQDDTITVTTMDVNTVVTDEDEDEDQDVDDGIDNDDDLSVDPDDGTITNINTDDTNNNHDTDTDTDTNANIDIIEHDQEESNIHPNETAPSDDNNNSQEKNKHGTGSSSLMDFNANDLDSDDENDRGSLYANLEAGFHYLQELDQAQHKPSSPFESYPVTVSFIDPTTKKLPIRKAWNRDSSSTSSTKTDIGSINIFSRLSQIFYQRYQSTLYNVPYSNRRTNASEKIDRIHVHAHLVGAPTTSTIPIAQSGKNPTSTTTSIVNISTTTTTTPQLNINDPTQWHHGPYCHVYIAACASLEHYRTRVRPALRAFVSQIEGAGGTGSSSSTTTTTNTTTTNGSSKSNTSKGVNGSGNSNGTTKKSNNSKGGGGGGATTTITTGTGSKAAAAAATTSTPSKPKDSKKKKQQLAAANVAAREANDASGSNHSTKYLIIFIPLPPSSLNDDESSDGNNHYTGGSSSSRGGVASVAGGLRGMVRRSRQSSDTSSSNYNNDGGGDRNFSILSNQSVDDTESVVSTMSTATNNNNTSMTTTTSSTFNTSSTQVLTKEQREVFKKFNIDFPNGRTCIMSTLLNQSIDPLDCDHPLSNQEWHTFLKHLGVTIVSGLNDRVKRYEDELRRYDQQRIEWNKVRRMKGVERNDSSTSSSEEKEDSKQQAENNDDDDNTSTIFEWNQYFLLKESLAFTYEQVDLPSESLREYEELEAMIPSESWRNDLKESATTNNLDTLDSTPSQGASFRSFLRRTKDITTIYYTLQKYIFARQIELLFLLEKPELVMDRFYTFIKTMYRLRFEYLKNVEDDSIEEVVKQNRARAVEAWIVSTCWDVKRASDIYFNWKGVEIYDKVNFSSSSLPPLLLGQSMDESIIVKHRETAEFIHSLTDILTFARVHLLKLGNLKETLLDRPKDTFQSWSRWTELDHNAGKSNNATTDKDAITTEDDDRSFWDESTLLSQTSVESKYLEMSYAIILLYRVSGRFRCASRIQAEQVAEIHLRREEYALATQNLVATIDDFLSEPFWGKIFAWRLFRLASCQRVSGGDITTYLATLKHCFNPLLTLAMPSKTLNLLQQDLEDVVETLDVVDEVSELYPLFDLEVSMESTKGGNFTDQLQSKEERLMRNVCSVGDTVKMEVSIKSNLPRPITVDHIKMVILDLEKFEEVDDMTSVIEDDVHAILDVGESVVIKPGTNTFQVPWVPMAVGQYVYAVVYVEWKNAKFFHDHPTTEHHMLLGIDVQPREPTQTIELNPIFLIPGHVQNVRLMFQSGLDVISEGRVEFKCSNGLKVKRPEADDDSNEEWMNSCELNLQPCEPGTDVVLLVSVKSDPIPQEANDYTTNDAAYLFEQKSPSLRAKVITSYYHRDVSVSNGEIQEPKTTPPMSAILEATVTTLQRPALTVDRVNIFTYDENFYMVNIVVYCNTPVQFSLKEWSALFPPPLKIQDDGDLNKDLFISHVVEGEELFFSFKCSRDNSDRRDAHEEATLHAVLKDDYGKTFRQVLPLVDLDNFCQNLSKKHELRRVINVHLNISSEEGPVGSPVTLSYLIDCGILSKIMQKGENTDELSTKKVHYSILCDDDGWIIGGQVQGCIDYSVDKKLTLSVVGIPTRSGVLKTFPRLELVDISSPTIPEIRVDLCCPTSFMSKPYTNHMAISYRSDLHEV